MANKASTNAGVRTPALIDAKRGEDGRFETVADREARKWAVIEARAVQIGQSVAGVIFFVVWYVWVAKPLYAWLWKATGAFNHWAGWS